MKAFIKRALPKPVFHRLNTLRKRARLGPARVAFAAAGTRPQWLPAEMLPRLQAQYAPHDTYKYDAASVERRGQERAEQILDLAGPTRTDFLELGCHDGMVSAALTGRGRVTAIDLKNTGFDERARAAGVELAAMDASALEFEDHSFDVVFSYDTFEHFADPRGVLSEAVRVLRPGGLLYLMFGPLYLSPRGLHAYRTVTVPYCHLLFDRATLDRFVADIGAASIDYDAVNGMSVSHFRRLWLEFAASLERSLYEERIDVSALDLVRRHPSCFRSKTSQFDDLIVSSIEVAFTKI